MSLIASLIYHLDVTISRALYSRTKSTFFYEIYFSSQLFFKFTMHAPEGKQTNMGGGPVEFNKYVHITLRCLLTTGKRAKKPYFQNGLCFEVFCDLLGHLVSSHTLFLYSVPHAKLSIISETTKKKAEIFPIVILDT